jgi:hypothetical protein
MPREASIASGLALLLMAAAWTSAASGSGAWALRWSSHLAATTAAGDGLADPLEAFDAAFNDDDAETVDGF